MVRLLKPDRPRARNYLSRREQWRLLLLVVPLILVIVADWPAPRSCHRRPGQSRFCPA